MNYIEQFIKDNGLTIDTYFEIYGRRGKYIFDANFVLWYKPIESNPPYVYDFFQ